MCVFSEQICAGVFGSLKLAASMPQVSGNDENINAKSKGNPTYPCFAYPRHPLPPPNERNSFIDCCGFGVCSRGLLESS